MRDTKNFLSKNWSRDNADDVDVQIATLAIQDVGRCVYVSLDRFT